MMLSTKMKMKIMIPRMTAMATMISIMKMQNMMMRNHMIALIKMS